MKPARLAIVIITLIALNTRAATTHAENWPQFRGPTGLGHTQETNLPTHWGGPDDKNILWKTPITGQGHASPIVWDDRVFVCTVEWPESVKDLKKVIPNHHLACYNAHTGKLLWDRLIPPGPWLRTDFRGGPGGGYAAATPATDGKLVFCAFASSVLAAVDFKSNIVWRKEITPHTFDVTLASSPILYKDTVILFCAMTKKEDSRVVAFDKAAGNIKWETKLSDVGFGHSTPLIINVNQKPQMLLLASGGSDASNALQSIDPANGNRIWWCRGQGDVAMPAYGSGIVYFDSGRSGPGTAVDPTGTGDVSETHIRWSGEYVPEALSSPTIVEDRIYRLYRPDRIECRDLKTGKLIYQDKLEKISTAWASPVADPKGRLFFANAGKSYVIQTGPRLLILATNDLGDGNHPSPAVANGKLYLAGTQNLYCIGK
ncbi:MAG: PQQ-binding-like beta-propeller repeat protein [Sedimentisphaerales bacterium]|nr:PQQ-binding-like beta-propeller repeat protein [Sedimentisphaerales bacterium]